MAAEVLNLDGEEYDLRGAGEDVHKILDQISRLDTLLAEKNNFMSVFTRSRNAYISDLKQEILRQRAGVDLTDFPEGD